METRYRAEAETIQKCETLCENLKKFINSKVIVKLSKNITGEILYINKAKHHQLCYLRYLKTMRNLKSGSDVL